MTIWINSGAKHKDSGNFKSKAALKRALRDEPQNVRLYTTAAFGTRETVTASDLGNRPHGKDEAWQVCGPDPYTDRRWYATVTVNRLSNLKVS